jgi:hypothetical protein
VVTSGARSGSRTLLAGDDGPRVAHDKPLWEDPREAALVLRDLAETEPHLRRTCTHEIDATQPLPDVVSQLAELGGDPSG